MISYVLTFALYIVFGLQPAEAAKYNIAGELKIDSISLKTDVAELINDGSGLKTPEKIAGEYSLRENKTLIIGHSTTVFDKLDEIAVDDEIDYNGTIYYVTQVQVVEKSKINMNKILAADDEDRLILMTCAGEIYDDGDASHRLLVEANREATTSRHE